MGQQRLGTSYESAFGCDSSLISGNASHSGTLKRSLVSRLCPGLR